MSQGKNRKKAYGHQYLVSAALMGLRNLDFNKWRKKEIFTNDSYIEFLCN